MSSHMQEPGVIIELLEDGEVVSLPVSEQENVEIVDNRGPSGPSGIIYYDDDAAEYVYDVLPLGSVVFSGPVNPDDLGIMRDGDAWLNTAAVAGEWPTAADIQAVITAVNEVDADRIAAEAAEAGAEAAAAAIPTMAALTTNLATNPGAEVPGGWSNNSGAQTSTRDTSVFHSGTQSVRSQRTTGHTTENLLSIYSTGLHNNSRVPCTPGQSYSISAWVRVNANNYRARIGLGFFTDSGSHIVSTYGTAVILTPNTWTRITASGVAPAGAAGFYPDSSIVNMGGSAAVTDADAAWIDSVSITQTELPVDFFDGSTPGARWTGTPHASTSELLIPRKSDLEIPVAKHDTSRTAHLTSVSLQAMRQLVSGGGTLTVTGSTSSLRAKWSTRFIMFALTRNGIPGFFEIQMPASGTVIPGVGGTPAATVDANGIPVTNWQTLYYILPVSGDSASLAANFRIANYTISDVDIPDNWVPVVQHNGDLDGIKFLDGRFVMRSMTSRYNQELVGSGSPEGVVAAPVGTQYTDLFTSSGAMVWRKWSGSSNTGWKVVEGDTGWRKITGPQSNGWTGNIWLRRVVDNVYCTLEGVNGSAATSDNIYTMPNGFGAGGAGTPGTTWLPIVDQNGESDPDHGITASQTLLARGNRATMNAWASLQWSTVQAWPTTLPGVVA